MTEAFAYKGPTLSHSIKTLRNATAHPNSNKTLTKLQRLAAQLKSATFRSTNTKEIGR
jgi:hypothetical protein